MDAGFLWGPLQLPGQTHETLVQTGRRSAPRPARVTVRSASAPLVVELQADLERWRLCGAPAIVELFTGYWLCRPCCDRLGREAMKLSGEWSGLHSAARLPTPFRVATPPRSPFVRASFGLASSTEEPKNLGYVFARDLSVPVPAVIVQLACPSDGPPRRTPD